MENEVVVAEEDSFRAEIAKSFAISLATTAGLISGLLLTGYVYGRITEARKARKSKRPQEES